jgi:hypothetical protein
MLDLEESGANESCVGGVANGSRARLPSRGAARLGEILHLLCWFRGAQRPIRAPFRIYACSNLSPGTVRLVRRIVEHFVYHQHNILGPSRGLTFFNSGFKSDPTELFPSIVQAVCTLPSPMRASSLPCVPSSDPCAPPPSPVCASYTCLKCSHGNPPHLCLCHVNLQY